MTAVPQCAEPDLEGKDARGFVERIDPANSPRGVMAVHLARYNFARGLAKGKLVLDVACGAGYGSAVLANEARRVVGVDRSEKAVRYARTLYGGVGTVFLAADAGRLPFPKGAFDAVVSFETIEHLPDIPLYLDEIRRVLRPGGVFVVSTPKAPRTTTKPANPHHTIEYSSLDFRAIMEERFDSVDLYSQVRAEAAVLRWLKKADVLGIRARFPVRVRRGIHTALGSRTFEEMNTGDQRIVPGDLRRADYIVAVCR